MKLGSTDVLVVGGGPAGLVAAIGLRTRGLQVTVADASGPVIDKACGEGLMPDSRAELAQLGLGLDPYEGREFTGIQFADRSSGSEIRASADFHDGFGLALRRVRLHRRLAELAQDLGVQLKWRHSIDLKPGMAPRLKGDPVRHAYLVGADGECSQVRRWANLDAGTLISRRFGFRHHFRLKPWTRYVEVYWTAKGQAYVTPIGDEEICVAVLTRSPEHRFWGVIHEIPDLSRRLQQACPTSRLRGALTTIRRLRHVTRGNVALIGDASGSSDAIAGQGLTLAFGQASLLADALSQGRLQDYQAGHSAILDRSQTFAMLLLGMDRSAMLRSRVIHFLAAHPSLFSRLLAMHGVHIPKSQPALDRSIFHGVRIFSSHLYGILSENAL